jgi:carbon starvation protein
VGATTILLKMGRTRHVWVTLVPMAWLVVVTMTASYQKIWHENPRIGFLAQARTLEAQIAAGSVPAERIAATERVVFNNRLDAVVTGLFATLILILLVEALLEWYRILGRRKVAALTETPYVRSAWAEMKP